MTDNTIQLTKRILLREVQSSLDTQKWRFYVKNETNILIAIILVIILILGEKKQSAFHPTANAANTDTTNKVARIADNARGPELLLITRRNSLSGPHSG